MSATSSSILIVDDEKINVALYTGQLKSVSDSITHAYSGAEALRMIAESPPDLVLLDVMMPGMTGFEVANQIKGNPATRNIPIIIVTALDDRGACLQALESGAEEFLTKPVHQAELLMRVRNLLRLKQYQDILEAHGATLEEKLAEGKLRLNEAQEKLLQSEKLASIGQLAAGVAHEINNPIGYVSSNFGSLKSYIQIFLELLGHYEATEALLPADAESVRELLKFKAASDIAFIREDIANLVVQSQDGIARVARIVKDLRDFARSDSVFSWVEADLPACLDSALNIAANEIRHCAEVRKELSPLPVIECMPNQLGQVFLNILVNAAQSIGPGTQRGTITIRTGCSDENEVWLEFQDSGCGMTTEQAKRIFEPFYTTKPVGVGTGLGLSISYGIIARHGGHIDVRSQPGQGSTFRVVLPIRQKKAAAQPTV